MSPDVAAECFHRGAPATETFGNGVLCEDCAAAVSVADDPDDVDATSGDWSDAEWTDPERDIYSPAWADRDRWMCHTHGDKKPFASWGDRDHPEADDDIDARWKWGLSESYTDLATAREWAEKHPQLAGVTYLLDDAAQEPFAFVDGDDVRCPETGEVHPEFVALLECLGTTYADVSTSGSGVHAVYRGDLPDGVKQTKVPLDDEPWSENDDAPVAEVYDHKKVCLSTGVHIPGTPVSVGAWGDDELAAWLDDHDRAPDPSPESAPADAAASFDPNEYDPETTARDETASDIQDLFAAIDRLDAQRVAARTIVHQWNDTASTSEGERPECHGGREHRAEADYLDRQGAAQQDVPHPELPVPRNSVGEGRPSTGPMTESDSTNWDSSKRLLMMRGPSRRGNVPMDRAGTDSVTTTPYVVQEMATV